MVSGSFFFKKIFRIFSFGSEFTRHKGFQFIKNRFKDSESQNALIRIFQKSTLLCFLSIYYDPRSLGSVILYISITIITQIRDWRFSFVHEYVTDSVSCTLHPHVSHLNWRSNRARRILSLHLLVQACRRPLIQCLV